jgi:hypothetical protein
LQKPKGTTLNCHSPWPVQNAVLSLFSGRRATFQSPLFKSRSRTTWLLPAYPACRRSSVVGSNSPW